MNASDPGSVALAEWREVTLQELLSQYDVVSIARDNPTLGDGAYIVVSGREDSVKLASRPRVDLDLRELGYTSLSPWTAWTRDELLPELRDKLGIRKWYDLKRNDGAVRGSLRLLKTPIQAAHWFVEPGADTTEGRNVAEFVQDCLFEELNVDWSQVLDDILLMFEYGYMVFEKVYTDPLTEPDGRTRLRKLAPRHPLDIREWIWDDRGGPAGIVMEPFVPYGTQFDTLFPPMSSNPEANLGQFIPIRKLAIFSLEPEGGDLRGISVLRSAYKHWFYKDTLYKIDAIQKERHGIGVPVIKLPPGYSEKDKKLADELGRNLRTNDRAHIVIPTNWEILFAKLEGQPVSCLESIDHHDAMIRLNILAPFASDPAPDETSIDMFFKSTRYLANTVAGIINKFVIRQLVDYNFKRVGKKYPKLRARRIGEWNDLRTFSFAVRNFVGAGLITPDDRLEAQLREEADLPQQDFATSRIVATPQNPGGDPQDTNVPSKPKPPKVGPPRQKARPPVGPSRGNSGRDSSGG
jgi:hypothetical protein